MTTITLDRLSTPRSAVSALLSTSASPANAILRVALGVVVLPHGIQKTLGWFGGWGLSGTLDWFSSIGVPLFLGVLAILADTLGALALILGIGTRVAAFGIAVNMIVATLLVHAPNGFFMNWSGKQAGEGFEFHILAAAMAFALMIAGGGRWSLDRAVTRGAE